MQTRDAGSRGVAKAMNDKGVLLPSSMALRTPATASSTCGDQGLGSQMKCAKETCAT